MVNATCVKLLKKLGKSLKIRQKWVSEPTFAPYPQHTGHWSRDLLTALAVINYCKTGRGKEKAERLLKRMPKD